MKKYSYEAVMDYISNLPIECSMLVIPEALLDTYVIASENAIEVLKATFVNSWESTYTRHIYRKRVPKWLYDLLDEFEEDITLPDGDFEGSEEWYVLKRPLSPLKGKEG